jgi:hypothetical protein
MHSLRRFWVAALTVAAGCSLFESGFSFKGDDASETGVDHGSPVDGAGGDAGSSFCASPQTHQLCEDFDDAAA